MRTQEAEAGECHEFRAALLYTELDISQCCMVDASSEKEERDINNRMSLIKRALLILARKFPYKNKTFSMT